MKWNRRLAPVVAGCFAAAMLVASCGKSEKTSEEKTPSALERIAKQASQQKQVSESEIADVAKMLAIAWTLRLPAVTGAIVGARNAKQVDGIIGAMDFRLTSQEIAEVEGK